MALAPSSDPRLFGIDLGQWLRQWQSAAALLLAHPALGALTPAVRVRLHQASGQRTLWSVKNGEAEPLPASAGAPQAEAIELPREEALERTLTLPALPQADLDEAVQLEVQAITPFKPEQTVAGYRSAPLGDGRVRVDLALTSHQRLDALLLQHARVSRPEVWVLPAGGHAVSAAGGAQRPICMPSDGARVRKALTARGRRLRLALLALALLLLLALAVTPTLQLRQRAIAAQSAYAAMSAQAAPQMAAREALQQQADRLAQLQQATGPQLRLVPALALLAEAMPSSAWISNLRTEGEKVFISGFAEDAAALVQRLSRQDGIHSARLSSPAIRNANAKQESFTIEVEFAPALQRLSPAGGEAAP